VGLVARREDVLQDIAEEIESSSKKAKAYVYPHDVMNTEEVPELFEKAVQDMGGLEKIIYAAGVMPEVELDEYDTEKDKLMVEINLIGMMAWCNEAADFFQRVKQGTIVGIGSVAGDRGRQDRPGYNASKGAQAIFLEALRNRLASRDVRVVTIKPGPVDTPMTAGLGNMPFMISADEAARRIVEAARKSNGTVYVPRRWRYIMLVIMHIPSFLFKKLGI